MLNYLSAALVAGVTLAAALPANAQTTYYGTSDVMAVAQEQNNADLAATAPQDRAQVDGTRVGRSDVQVYGYAAEPDVARSNERSSGVYLGTAWRYQDNADIVRR